LKKIGGGTELFHSEKKIAWIETVPKNTNQGPCSFQRGGHRAPPPGRVAPAENGRLGVGCVGNDPRRYTQRLRNAGTTGKED